MLFARIFVAVTALRYDVIIVFEQRIVTRQG